MTLDANDYHIYLADRDGKLVAKLDNTDGRAACCIESADNTRGILKTDRSKSAFAQMTAEYVEHFMAAWFLIEGQGTEEERKVKVATEFNEMFLNQFPALYISDRLRHLRVTGATRRIMWEHFFPIVCTAHCAQWGGKYKADKI